MAIIKRFTILTIIIAVNSKQEFSQRVTNFSFELLYFTALETDGHTVLSPFGIWTLMTAVAQGAEGTSYEQLRRALNFPKGRKELFNGYKLLSSELHAKSDQKTVTLQENNFMFTERNFQINPDFKRVLEANFDTYVIPLDFSNPQESSAKVNDLITKTTNGQITDALTPGDFKDARIILTNVIHFKGLWKAPFNTTDTKVEPFYDENDQKVGDVNMMYQRAPFPFTNMKTLGAFVVEVPYGGDNRFSMLVILSYAGLKLMDMFKNFQHVSLNDILLSLDNDQEMFPDADVDFYLPRFKISTNVVLNKPLNDMGIYDIFDPAVADFKGLTSEQVFVSKVVHKADIEVTESGTVASAVTQAGISNRNPPANFKLNRPFLYLITEKMSSTILFGGVYSKPSVF